MCRNFSAFEGRKNVCVVYKSAARKVYDANSVFHCFDWRRVDHSFCFVCLWYVDCDVVCFCVDSFESFWNFYVMVEGKSGFYRKERIVSDYVHSEGDCCVCNLSTDCAESDYAECFAFKFRSDKFWLAFFCQCRDFVAFAGELCVYPFVCCYNRTAWDEEGEDYEFFNCVCVCSRSIEYYYAFFCELFARDVVCSSSCAGYGLCVFWKCHFVHISRANENCVRIVEFWSYFVIVARKVVKSDNADFI